MRPQQHREHSPAQATGSRLPWGPLLALALAGFICIMTETLPVGLLGQIAEDMDVSEAAIGQWVSVYAIATAVTVVPMIAWTRSFRRRPLLIIAATGFLLANGGTAIAPTYEVTVVARAAAGVFSGLIWGMLAGYARRLVPAHQSGRALAIALVGTPVALSIGTPLGAFVGGLWGWRWAFGLMSLVALGLIIWALAGVPDRPGQPRSERLSVLGVLRLPGVLPVLVTALCWILAHNILYIYIEPYIQWRGVPARVDVALLVFGLASLAGIWVTGRLIDRALRPLVLTSLAFFAVAALALSVFPGATVVFWVAVIVWGLTFGGAATQVTTAATDAAGQSLDIAQALLVVTFNSAIFAGGAFGGAIMTAADPGAVSWFVLALAALALSVAFLARRHSFVPGPRND